MPDGVGPGTIKALRILQHHGPLRPGEFAKLMWPDSEGWDRSWTCGQNANANQRGKGMYLAGGSFLAKLAKRGFVWRRPEGWGGGYIIEPAGSKLLAMVSDD